MTMKKMNKFIANWEKATNDLALEFVEKYFIDADWDSSVAEYWRYYCRWAADDVGGILEVCDYLFDLDLILLALKNNVSHKLLFNYSEERTTANFSTYIKINGDLSVLGLEKKEEKE